MNTLRHPRTWPLWDILYPPLCAVCERPLRRDDLLYCATCWADAPVAEPHLLPRREHVDMVVGGFRYGGADVVRAAVRALKYDGLRKLAPLMAQKLVTRLPIRYLEPDLVWSAVPLHWTRYLARGFNQSLDLSRALAVLCGHAPPRRLLRRTRPTPTQTARTFRERARNVQGAFAICRRVSVPKRVLLIDDVITTGATVNECAATLKKAGTEWVAVLTFAVAQHS